MKAPELWRTTALRLTLLYAALYGAVLALLFAAVLWTTSRHIDPGTRAALQQRFADLRSAYQGQGEAGLHQALDALAGDGWYVLLADANGEAVAGNLPAWPLESDIELDGQLHGAWFDEAELPRGEYDDDTHLPVIAAQLSAQRRLLLARRVEQSGWLYEAAEYLLESLGAALVLAFLISLAVSRRILRRMQQIHATAAEIMAGDLGRRVPLSGRGDEFDALARQLNAMLERIGQLIRGIRGVTDSIAHDLRSPLTRLRSRLELALMREGEHGDADCREAMRQGIEDADGLIHTFNALLGIAQAEAGNHRAQWGPVDLAAVIEDLADLFGALAEERRQELLVVISRRAQVTGSRDLLAQAIGNLIENAIKYAPEGGLVRVALDGGDGATELMVADNGPGIPEAERERVLERFVRLDNARGTAGNGLGLSLVEAVAKLHGARLVLEDARPGLKVALRFAPEPGPQKSPV